MTFEIKSGRWYGWQMIPGYAGIPYFSPIFIFDIQAIPGPSEKFEVSFHNALYAQGVQNMSKTINVLRRGEAYLVAALADDHHRTVVISQLTENWLRYFCSGLLEANDQEYGGKDPQSLMNDAFGVVFK